jgi:protein SCO1/2
MLGFGRIFCIFISLAWASFARSYIVDGLVVAINPPSFTLAHRPIPGYMQAMTMDFRAASGAEVKRLRVGMRVRFELRDDVARDLRIVPPDEKDMPAPARQPVIGQPAPDFKLIDEHGRDVTLRSFRGKLVALNFIYTRCPMPEVCPRLVANFAALQRRFTDAMGRDLILLSITIDPQWDTPHVLAAYAKLWRAREDDWRFLTGSSEAVRHAATDWGLVYWPEEGAIVHTSRTALIGRDGKLLAVVEGSSFRTDQLIALIQRHLEAK